MSSSEIDNLAISTIRLLSVDQVAKANSGHPGAPLGLAPVSHFLWKQMNFNSKNPKWLNRDRFILSNGHSVALLYSLLHLFGYPLTLDDLSNFRQLGSKTPGHPESETPGIDVTTGPLGQGIANAVGLAIAQQYVAATFNEENFTISDNYTYAFLGDGCLMEGVSSEAMSLAGHLKLSKLIAIYDDNHISIDGSTDVAFTEDVTKRLESYGWNVIWVKDGNNDFSAIQSAIEEAKSSIDKPTLIKLTTKIGFGSLNEGTAGVHGSPLKPDDIKQLKTKFGFDPTKTFQVPQEVYGFYKNTTLKKGELANENWDKLVDDYQEAYPEKGQLLKRLISEQLPENWKSFLPTYKPGDKSLASRKLSEIVLQNIHQVLPELIGGSADLTGSNLTRWTNAVDFQPPSTGLGDYSGRYIRYGVREHAMGAIMNGIAAYGYNLKPYGGTFLNFVSYAAGALRLSALSGHPVIWVATHDSIGLGEDGPTHQPIETLAHFRAIPNLMVWRPADGNETSAAYLKAISTNKTPSVIALTRQNIPQLEGSSIEKALKGGYTLVKTEYPDIILVSTGSEVSLCVEAAKHLKEEKNINANVVSLPDFYSFDEQSDEYKLSVFPNGVPILSVEVLSTVGWSKYSHAQFGIDRFGASGPADELYEYFGFTIEGVSEKATKVVDYYKGKEIISPLNKPF
ncbi:transketolase TKL1 [Ascoidea rubescens DSM 1968]|uniref:Transketolase n=1 Tax=Ascoidea rubescens DSM 1968 TaxID=1344418 RepID=A0A1D2V8A6_9ASCO|nr:transketolase 1 [Ascoidea rubescens DSM 1968]ODV57850.1 transketolase 1 [Ascoidea rubescens DSM 1968]